MKKMKMLTVLLVASLVLVSSSTLLGRGTTQIPQGGTVTMGMVSEPTVLDSISGSWNVAPFAGNMFNSLLETTDDMKTVAGLAESWNVDYEAKTITFNLRSGVQWHDGAPFTAEDVKFSFETFLPQYDNRGKFLVGTTVEILDSSTVVMKPGDWAPGIQIPRLASADWVVFPKHLLEQYSDKNVNSFAAPGVAFRSAPVGTGPFKFKEWERGSYVIMERNENYWKPGLPHIDQIITKFITDSTSLLGALYVGDVDYVYRGLPYEAYASMEKDPDLNVILDPRPNYKVFLVFQLNGDDPAKKAILSNLDVRKAFAHAINKDDVVLKATAGIGRRSDRIFAPELAPPVNANHTFYDYDPAKAAQLLDDAGYPLVDGKRFSLEVLLRTGEADETKFAELLRDYMADLGVEITIKAADFTTILQLGANYQFDLEIIKRWINPVFAYYNHHSFGIQKGVTLMNYAQYSNPKVDYWYDQWGYNAKTEEAQMQALLNAESILSDELPEIPIYDVTWMYAWNARIGNAFATSRQWLQCEPLENIYIIPETPMGPQIITTTVSGQEVTVTVHEFYGTTTLLAIGLSIVCTTFYIRKRREKWR